MLQAITSCESSHVEDYKRKGLSRMHFAVLLSAINILLSYPQLYLWILISYHRFLTTFKSKLKIHFFKNRDLTAALSWRWTCITCSYLPCVWVEVSLSVTYEYGCMVVSDSVYVNRSVYNNSKVDL